MYVYYVIKNTPQGQPWKLFQWLFLFSKHTSYIYIIYCNL